MELIMEPVANKPTVPTIAAIASLIIFAGLTVACSGESRMTVAEYARWCGDARDSLTDDANASPTYGEF